MKVTRFDPASDLITVRARLWGPVSTEAELEMVVDTGAAITVVAPHVLDHLGYSPRDGEAITTMRSAVAAEPGYLIRVMRLRVLGYETRDFRVHAHDLPEGFEIHGLLAEGSIALFTRQAAPAAASEPPRNLDSMSGTTYTSRS